MVFFVLFSRDQSFYVLFVLCTACLVNSILNQCFGFESLFVRCIDKYQAVPSEFSMDHEHLDIIYPELLAL